MTNVEELYKYYEVLTDAKDKASTHEKEYLVILEAVKGGPNEKRLASQLITRFFKYFPHLAAKAINSQLDLCEDDDVTIRKQAIRDLPLLCKDSPENLPRIADVLAQLLQTEDVGELNLVQTSLLSLMKKDVKGGLQGLFTQIESGEDVVRERAIKFLAAKLKVLSEDVVTKPIEDFIIEQTKKVLKDVTGDEFMTFISILSGLKTMATVQGRQQLVEVITEQAGLSEPFEGSNSDSVDRLVQCCKQASTLFSRNVHSTKFVAYFCDSVLPSLDKVTDTATAAGAGSAGGDPAAGATAAAASAAGVATSGVRLELLKLLADIVPFSPNLDELPRRVETVYSCLLNYMPLPPAETINGESGSVQVEPKLQFSFVECLLHVFHQMARRHPDFLAAEVNSERLKDFKLRLQYFARGVQVYTKQLQAKVGDALKTDENKIKVTALKITSNINQIIKDLLHVPPNYKATIILSWKPELPVSTSDVSSASSVGQATKRPGITPAASRPPAAKQAFKGAASADKEAGGQTARGDRPMYSPPTGKYSEKAGAYAGTEPDAQKSLGNGAGRRGRGRGSWRIKY